MLLETADIKINIFELSPTYLLSDWRHGRNLFVKKYLTTQGRMQCVRCLELAVKVRSRGRTIDWCN